VSALLHGLALTMAFGLMAQVKSVAPKEVFKWDIALVEPQRIQETRQAEITPTQESAKPTPRPAVSAPSQPQMLTQEVQPREETPVVEREIRQVVETSQPIQQTVAVQTRTEAGAPVVQHEAVTAEPVITAAPMQQPVTTEASVHPVEARGVETASVPRDLDAPASPAQVTSAASDSKPAEPVMRESAPQVAMATRPTPAVKADHGWLAESLWRRVAELQRYPSSARLNGWEGKVVLRVVIRADGHLADVRIQKSSGYDALDRAALEAVRLACPLHMKHALNASEVAMNLPMVYSLAN
jgi:periplasmic protein TonB